ncbi:MAG: hypothetical protein ACP5KA_01685 [Desulfurococcaceae archaeon]|jgi:hypothetical protein
MSTYVKLCDLRERLHCREAGFEVVDSVVVAKSEGTTPVMFVVNINEFVVCPGLGFQVHVWGLEKIVFWILPEGVSKCILLRDVFVDECGEGLYTISRTPGACNKLAESGCLPRALRVSSTSRTPIFVCVDLDVEIPAENIIEYENLCRSQSGD